MNDLAATLCCIRRSIYDISEMLRVSDASPIEYFERLTADRNALLHRAHHELDMDVVELSRLSGVPWTQVYAIIDAVQAEKDAEKPSTE